MANIFVGMPFVLQSHIRVTQSSLLPFSLFLHVLFCFKVGLDKIVNEKGCLQAGEEWLEHNLLTVAGIAVGIAFLQVCLPFVFLSLFVLYLFVSIFLFVSGTKQATISLNK